MLRTGNDVLSIAALVLMNLLPLVGVVLWGWDAAAVVLLYWSENLIIGAYTVLKMILAPVGRPAEHLAKLAAVPFFCIHYGGFCAGHGFFILVFLSMREGGGDVDGLLSGDMSLGPLVFLQLLFNVVVHVWRTRPPEMVWPFLALVVSHGVSFVQNFLLKGEYGRTSINELMVAPYKRIVLLHIAIIAAGFFVMTFGSPLPLLIILIALKIGMDVWLHRKEHRKA